MTPARLLGWALAAALALGAAGCGEQKAVEGAVRAYNDEAIRAYRLNDPGRMGQVATQREADRVLVLVDLKASNRIALESTLERFAVTKVTVAPDKAQAETEERWRYFDRPLVPGRSPGPTIVSEMRMRYDCVKEAGKWKVAEVSTISNEILEPKGYQHQGRPSQRPAPSASTPAPAASGQPL